MKKILVPTDFSDCAQKALLFAANIAQKANAEIILMHAGTSSDEETEKNGQHVGSQLQALKQQMELTHPIKITTKAMEDSLADSLHTVVTDDNIDLIVMGTQGASGFKKKLMGSNTAAAINQITKPVLSIPYQYSGEGIHQILLAINHSEKNLTCLEPVFELARLFGAQVQLAIYTGESEEAVDYIDDRRTITGIQFQLKDLYGQNLPTEHLTGDDFEETLQQHINANEIDLLVMITHKRNIMERLFHKSMTRQMLYHTTIPLLSIHQQ